MIDAIFFDIDGTLVSFRTHVVSPAVLDALHRLRAKGVKLFISTGRHPEMISYVRSVFPFDGYITLSGQYCYVGDTVVRCAPMDRESVEALVQATQDNAFACIFLDEHSRYLNCENELTDRFIANLNITKPDLCHPRRALEGNLFQAVAFLDEAHQHLLLDRAPGLKTTRWHPDFLDVIPLTGGKDLGMDAILSHLSIPLANTMAFGDGENDLSMLIHAGLGVAMGSASDEVKSRADYVTGTVDEDGILTALEHFGLL